VFIRSSIIDVGSSTVAKYPALGTVLYYTIIKYNYLGFKPFALASALLLFLLAALQAFLAARPAASRAGRPLFLSVVV